MKFHFLALTGGPVSKAVVDPIPWELFRPGSSEDEVSGDTSVDYLDNDLPVGEPDDKSILWRIAIESYR